ncbi:aconitate hydratase [Halodesulfovibrio sp. MK-HDV]|jgi:predicted aconitate hydratase|uniref:aconitate hydratase n=1 Tax=Halodesulfovibrio sp. MK-HDV TaxID=2599925 RepID=UPI0013702A4F|nr:aconitate hydratase [Halodesulfovibrio sp. MK-HDV]KAF1074331.1 3-isopropylmalate dehydratase large subunit [Halodesulfovibrio sp. MK-HDV]
MPQNVTKKIISGHLISGTMSAGSEIELRIDQTLTQDATGTMACLQFEALGVDRVKTDLSVSYVDHNTLQMGFRNPDDHRYLKTVAEKYGIVFSPAGTGICHQLHLENFGKPGATLVGSDSHTPTAGGLGSLAMGAGGLSVALAMAGEPYTITMPQVVRVYLEGELTGWASAKDVILHLLGKLTVKGGVGKVFEFAGPGVASLSVPERAVITNMGAELGATTSIFPSDENTREFMSSMGRLEDWTELVADEGAEYDEEVRIILNDLEPLAAKPHMPDQVVTVASLAGLKVNQVAIGSCTNSSYADLASVANLFAGKHVKYETDTLISPGSKQVLKMLTREGLLENIIDSGARLLECSCGPCIGMGGSPVSEGVSVRTFNRNFEGRSGTRDAQVYLVSPLTAAMAALHGEFTDPAGWGDAPKIPELPKTVPSIRDQFIFPPEDGSDVEIVRGPNIVPLEQFASVDADIDANVLIVAGDNITTDHIMPAGAVITALRSNVPAISEHVFERMDASFATRAKSTSNGVIVAGENYGQGSSREHAALAPRHLGVRAVVAKSFARIHRANLVNFGILPFILVDKEAYAEFAQEQNIAVPALALAAGESVDLILSSGTRVTVTNDLTQKELDIIRAGGLLNYVRFSKSREA